MICRSCILNAHFPIKDEELGRWDLDSYNYHLKSPSFPIAIVSRMIRSMVLNEEPRLLRYMRMMSFTFRLNEEIIRPNSAYCVFIEIDVSETKLVCNFKLKERISPSEDVMKMIARPTEYGSGQAIVEFKEGHSLEVC